MRSGITVVFTAVVFWLAAPYTMLVAQERGVAARAAHAQAQPKAKRPPTRLRVTPRCPYRTESTNYPPPTDCDFPGPGYVRQCTSWLAQEYRPSGTVIVPRMQCWWQRG